MPTRVAVTVDPMAAPLLGWRGGEGAAADRDGRAAENTITDREAWLAVGHGLHYEAHGTPYEEGARSAWIDWCRRWDGERIADTLAGRGRQDVGPRSVPEEVLASGKPDAGRHVMHYLRPQMKAELPPISEGGLFRRPTQISEDMPPWLVENLIRVGGTQAVVG